MNELVEFEGEDNVVQAVGEESAPTTFACKCGRVTSSAELVAAYRAVSNISELPPLLEAICATTTMEQVVGLRGVLREGEVLWLAVDERDVKGREVPASKPGCLGAISPKVV